MSKVGPRLGPDYSKHVEEEKAADVQQARHRLRSAWEEFNNALFDGSPTVLAAVVEQIGDKHMRHLIDALEAFRPGNEPRGRGRPSTDRVLDVLAREVLSKYRGEFKWSLRQPRRRSKKTGKRTGSEAPIPGHLSGWFYPRMKRRAAALGIELQDRQCKTLLRRESKRRKFAAN